MTEILQPHQRGRNWQRIAMQVMLGLALSVSPIENGPSVLMAAAPPQEPVPSAAQNDQQPVPQVDESLVRVAPAWTGPSMFEDSPKIVPDEKSAFISVLVDGNPWVIAMPHNIYVVKGDLEDGTNFQLALGQTITKILQPYIENAKRSKYKLDVQPQSPLGNVITINESVEEGNPGTLGMIIENPYGDNESENKTQIPVPSYMRLNISHPFTSLKGLDDRLDDLLDKSIADLTPDEFLDYLTYFIGPLINHEFGHQVGNISDQIVYYSLENQDIVRIVRILPENSAMAAEIFGKDRLLKSMDIPETIMNERSLQLLELEWRQYFQAVFGNSYNPLAPNAYEYGSMLPTSSSDYLLRYEHGMILIYLMSVFGHTTDLQALEKDFVAGFQYNDIPYMLVNEVPQDEIRIEELYEQLKRIFPESEITPELIRYNISDFMYKLILFQQSVNTKMNSNSTKEAAIDQTLIDMDVHDSILESAFRAFVRLDSDGEQKSWSSREINIVADSRPTQVISLDSHRGAGHILKIEGKTPSKFYIAETDGLKHVTATLCRSNSTSPYASGDLLLPGDILIIISNQDGQILDIVNEKPIYDKLPIGTFVKQAPLPVRAYLPSVRK